MASSCALYDYLVDKLNEGVAQSVDVKRMCLAINNLEEEHNENIYILIFHHETLENKGVSFRSNPYRSKTMDGGKGVIFTLSEFPGKLQQIIALYIALCSE